jgi:hypothetical protein
MTNSRRLLCAAIILVMALSGGIDAMAADLPAGDQKIVPRAIPGGFAAKPYDSNPWVRSDVLPSMASALGSKTAALRYPSFPLPQVSGKKQRSGGRKFLGAVVGAAGGFFGGAYLGAAIEGECNCDDPGLRGAIIGAPIGAVTGGILGYKFLF